MKKDFDFKYWYNCSLEAVVEYAEKKAKGSNTYNELYHEYRGRTHAFGQILGYEFDQIEADIAAEIEKPHRYERQGQSGNISNGGYITRHSLIIPRLG